MPIFSAINSFLLEHEFIFLFAIVLSFMAGFLSGVHYKTTQMSQTYKLSCPHSNRRVISLKTLGSKLIYNSCPYAKSVKFCKKLNTDCILKDNLNTSWLS